MSSKKRSSLAPEVPTLDESGVPGHDVVASSSEFFTDFLRSEVARWGKVVQDANIRAD